MINHPNRSKGVRMAAPVITPEMVFGARCNARHTQTEAAKTVFRSLRGWQDWEGGKFHIDPAIFELYLIKTHQIERWRTVFPQDGV